MPGGAGHHDLGVSRPLLADDPQQVGAWRLTARLGEGGFGVVYHGVGDDGRHGAVKVMHRHLAGEADYVARFGREAALAQQVRGDHVARVLDHDLQAAPPYLVTEFVDGPTLHDEITRHGSIADDNLYGLALALAEAISSIAAAGVVHRDLKPGNVLLTRRTPVVVDFGIASGAGLERLTATGLVMGTTPFMAPEQFTGVDAGPAIDVFAWASVVSFAANGRAPFRDDAGNASAVMYQVIHAEADPGALRGPLAELVAAAHTKDPRARPTAPALVARLVAIREPAANDPVRTSVMLVERTWHLVPEPPPPPPPPPPATPVAPAPVPTRPLPPPPPPQVAPQGPPRVAAPNVVYTPPRPPGASPRPAAPPPAPPKAPTSARYPLAWVAPWVHGLPDFGKLGTISALVYLAAGRALDEVDDGVAPTGLEQARAIDVWSAAWALRLLVLLLVVGFVAQRIVRAAVARRGLTAPEWRGFAAASSVLGVGLSLVPLAATVVLAYGPAVLEPNGRLSVEAAVAAGAGAFVMGMLAIVGLVFAVRAVAHVGRSLVGSVVRRG